MILEHLPEAEAPSLPQAESKPRTRRLWREILETIILTILIFAALRLAFQNFVIHGQSMEPNFYDGQFLVVNRLLYLFRPPARGEVIVLLSPDAPTDLCLNPVRQIGLNLALLFGLREHNPCQDFIKRIVGLPGEEMEIREGQVFISGERLREPYVENRSQDNLEARVLGSAEYFVLGDNRTNSSDSRQWGSVPRENIIGLAWLCYWPPNCWGLVPQYAFAN